MARVLRRKDWDQEHEDVRVRLVTAKLAARRNVVSLKETQLKHDRMERLGKLAGKKSDDTRIQLAFEQRQVEQAERNLDDARRNGLSRHRWNAELRRWQTQAERTAQGVRRWDDEDQRDERELQGLQKEIREKREELDKQLQEVKVLGRRFDLLRLSGRGLTAVGKSRGKRAAQTTSKSFSVTSRAAGALEDVLNRTEHRPDELLRLVPDAGGTITVAIDTAREGDSVVKHLGRPVLLIGTGLPTSLRGKTLDISESYEGTQIVLAE